MILWRFRTCPTFGKRCVLPTLSGFTSESVTLVKAAEVAGVSLYDFMGICKSNQIPVIDITREELLDELAGFNPT